MIIEDEFGNDIELNDLPDDREPEQPDPSPPLSLEEIEAAYTKAMAENSAAISDDAKLILFEAVPQMLAELRRWHSLNAVEEYTVTIGGKEPEPDRGTVLADDSALSSPDFTGWIRNAYHGGWMRLSDEPPF